MDLAQIQDGKIMNTWKTAALFLTSLFLLASHAQSGNEESIDMARETARSAVLDHIANLQTAPPGGFLPVQARDFGNIAVIEASTKTGILTPKNTFDLGRKSIVFKRAADGSYSVRTAPGSIGSEAGNSMLLAPGESKAVALPFSFPFYRHSFRSVFVHPNGNLTLGKPANLPFGLDENIIFHTTGRIAPLDVYLLGQNVEVSIASNSTQSVVTWKIPDGGVTARVQAVLFKTGDISFKYESFSTDTVAVTGITPGPIKLLPQAVDFSGSALDSIRGAMVEKFTPTGSFDQIAMAKAFFSAHSDTFDMLAVFSDARHPGRPSYPETGFDVIYQNNIRGIGRPQYNYAKLISPSGRLKAIAYMHDFGAYPNDPHQNFPGYGPETGRTPLELVSHEIAHYWLATPRIIENGVATTNLLSDCCHWSFGLDADGSFMNGNDIQDNGNGTFTTGAPLVRFSALDQYLMGLIPPSQVGPMFYVSGPNPIDDPRAGLTFNGTRVPVIVDQIIAAEGPRVPAADASQHSFRVAFILMVDEGRTPSQQELQRLETLRTVWPGYFEAAASNHITMSSTLTD